MLTLDRVYRGIVRDPHHPGGELGFSPESSERNIHLDQHVLNEIFGIVGIPEKTVTQTENSFPVFFRKNGKGRGIPGQRFFAENQIIINRERTVIYR